MEHGARLDGFLRPVKQAESLNLAELRRFVGRGPTGEPLSPDRRLPPRGRRRKPGVPQPPPAPVSNPLH
jgi:hypothetical protein